MDGEKQEPTVQAETNGTPLSESTEAHELNGVAQEVIEHISETAQTNGTAHPASVTVSATTSMTTILDEATKADLQRRVDDYMVNRWQDQYDYYSTKANMNKKIYQRIRLTVALIGFLIPVTVTVSDVAPIVPALLGVAVSFLTAWETIYRYGDNWRSFRRASEELKRERVYYDAGAGAYTNPQDAFIRFVNNCEAIMAQESGNFFKQDSHTQDNSNQGGGG
jgi:hypothetical protein